jgi:hypothetical protein
LLTWLLQGLHGATPMLGLAILVTTRARASSARVVRRERSVLLRPTRTSMKDRASAPDTVDIQQFMDLVLAQRKADLVDLLDDKLRNDSKAVKLTTSAGQVKAMIGQMSDADQQDVIARLEGLGHDAEEIQKFFAGPVEPEGSVKPKAAAKKPAAG